MPLQARKMSLYWSSELRATDLATLAWLSQSLAPVSIATKILHSSTASESRSCSIASANSSWARNTSTSLTAARHSKSRRSAPLTAHAIRLPSCISSRASGGQPTLLSFTSASLISWIWARSIADLRLWIVACCCCHRNTLFCARRRIVVISIRLSAWSSNSATFSISAPSKASVKSSSNSSVSGGGGGDKGTQAPATTALLAPAADSPVAADLEFEDSVVPACCCCCCCCCCSSSDSCRCWVAAVLVLARNSSNCCCCQACICSNTVAIQDSCPPMLLLLLLLPCCCWTQSDMELRM
mmetsp:Transcript_33028/g.64801  ORF Transcript_33028/g.64801 Transcript_33028/m.64801 type:complete len:298 (+) Transcript_33028:1299-2192(+)